MTGSATGMTPDQDRVLGSMNDSYGVATWEVRSDGRMYVICDDGDRAIVSADGEITWTGDR